MWETTDPDSRIPQVPGGGTRERSIQLNLGAPYLPAFCAGRCGKSPIPIPGSLKSPVLEPENDPSSEIRVPHIYRRFLPVDVGNHRSRFPDPSSPRCWNPRTTDPVKSGCPIS